MRSGLFACVLAAAAAACGPSVPGHSGYPAGASEPWADAQALELDAGEAEVDDVVSYGDRRRARWYAARLPAGDLRARLVTTTWGGEPAELGLEVYRRVGGEADAESGAEAAADGYRLVAGSEDAEPAGAGEIQHDLSDLRAGRYLVHVFAVGRTDAADFTLRLRHEAGAAAGSAAFPETVAYVGELPTVPAVDDAPARRRTRPKRRRRPRETEDEPEPVTARIAGITATGSGTRIRINRGANHGVAAGWSGAVTTRSGNEIPDGAFEVERVTPREAFATVKASLDAITAAKYVRLRPP